MLVKPENGATEWVDPDDAPELTDEDFDRGTWSIGGVPIPTPPRRGRPVAEAPKVHTRLRIDPDVLDYFRASGKGWQTRINAALRRVMETGG